MIRALLYLINLGFAIVGASFLTRTIGKGSRIAGDMRTAIKERFASIQIADKSISELTHSILLMVICFALFCIPVLNIFVTFWLYKNETLFADKFAEHVVREWDKTHSQNSDI